MAKKRSTATTSKDQPMPAIAIATEVTVTGAQRMNILHDLTGRDMDFATSKKLGKIWDAILCDWDWGEFYRDTSLMSKDEQKEFAAKLEVLAPEEFGLKMTRPVLENLQEFIQKKLDQKAPPEPKQGQKPEPDTRWKGQRAIVMRKLWDKIHDILEEDH